MGSKVVQLVGVGSVLPAQLRLLEEPLLRELAVQPVLSRLSVADIRYAYNKDRQQYHSRPIMRRLPALLQGGAQFLLAVGDMDLFEPDADFILGESDRQTRIALMSLFRLRQGVGAEGFKRRAQMEALNLVAHLVGLAQCEDQRCVMSVAATPADCDRKNLALCNVCRNEYARLNKV